MLFKIYAFKELILIYLIFLILGLSSTFVIPLLPALDQYYGLSTLLTPGNILQIDFATIEAIFISVATISLLFWGYAIDKYDRKKFLLLGTFLAIIGVTIIVINTKNVFFYFIGRVIFMALGLGVYGPIAYSYAGDVIQFKSRSIIAGTISVIGIIASGLGIIVSVILFKLTGDIFTPYLFIILILLVFLVSSIFFRDPLRGREEPEIKILINEKNTKIRELGVEYSHKVTLSSIRILLRRKTNLIMFGQGIFALISSVILTYFLISFFSDSNNGGLGFPIEYAMILAMAPSTGRIFGYMILGHLGDRLHNKSGKWYSGKAKPLIAGMSMLLQGPLMIIAFLILLPSYNPSFSILNNISKPEYVLFGLFFFLAAFIGGGSGPNRRAITYDINEPELRGQASSVFSIGDSLGASLGLMLGSFLIKHSNYNIAFQIISIGYIVAGFIWVLAFFTIKQDEEKLRMKIQKRISLKM